MKRLLAGIFTFTLSISGLKAEEDPLSFARKGYTACGHPRADNTCLTFSNFEFKTDGTILETDEIAIAGPPLLTVVFPKQSVIVNADSVCVKVRIAPTLDNIIVKREGIALDKQEAWPLVATWLKSIQALNGKEICESYQNTGDRSITTYSIDGKPAGGTGMEYQWLKSIGEFKLSPF